MEIALLGLNYKTAPIELREKLSVPNGKALEFLRVLQDRQIFRERVLISTCNRTEIYGACEDFENSIRSAKKCLAEYASLDEGLFEGNLYALRQPDSIQHLFSVASGLDSMIIGETEILGQVKNAYLSAHQSHHTGKILNTLFQRSLKVAKNLRTNTDIGVGKVSVASVAVDLAAKIFSDFTRAHVLVLGTGEMATQVTKALVSKGAWATIVSSTHFDRAKALAANLGVAAVDFQEYEKNISGTDILIASTSAPHALIQEKKVRSWMKLRHDRPLFLIDIALPRNIDSQVEKIDNVYLYNLDDLKAIADKNLSIRENEMHKCLGLIGHQTQYFMAWFSKEFSSSVSS